MRLMCRGRCFRVRYGLWPALINNLYVTTTFPILRASLAWLFSLSDRRFKLLALAFSLLLSGWSVWQADLLNVDGVLYLQAAETLRAGDWHGAMLFYPWPFYSMIIATLDMLLPGGAELAGHLFNAVAIAGALWVLLALLQLLGGDRRVLLAGALLFFTNEFINDYRHYMVRDFAYWWCYLGGLFFLIRYARDGRSRDALFWGGCMVLAGAFRLEGLVIWALGPLPLLFTGLWRRYLLSNIVLAGGVAAAGLFAWLAPDNSFLDVSRLTEPLEAVGVLWNTLVHDLPVRGYALADAVLDKRSRTYGPAAILLVIGMVYLVKVFNAVGVIVLAGSWLAWRLSAIRQAMREAGWVVWFALLNLLILWAYLLIRLYLSERFLLPLTLTLLLPAAFALAWLFSAAAEQGGTGLARHLKGVRVAVAVLLIALFADGVEQFGEDRSYVREAGVWLAEQGLTNREIAANNALIYYYAGQAVHKYVWSDLNGKLLRGELEADDWRRARYLAVKIRPGQRDLAAYLAAYPGLTPVRVFGDPGRGRVEIYRIDAAH